ncbi:hypothetical protein Tco_0220817, partial [Tanacetum coccineum]
EGPSQLRGGLTALRVIVEEHPRARRKQRQKVKTMQEDTGNQVQGGKDPTSRMKTCPNHGYARKLIRSLPASATLIFQKRHECQIITPRQGGNARRNEKENHHNTLASI